MSDRRTVAYFDSYTPEYYEERYNHVVEVINAQGGADASLIDIGCGNGNILEFIKKKTSLRRLVGMDVSRRYLEQAAQRVQCETVLGSILDDEAVASIGERFDWVVAGALLHHLVGGTRRRSRALAVRAVRNAVRLLKDGGCLFILEPAYSPSFLMTVVFYVKSMVTRLTSRRIGLFNEWANIGAPVVSYYTREQLLQLARATPGIELVGEHTQRTGRVWLFLRRTELTLVFRKAT